MVSLTPYKLSILSTQLLTTTTLQIYYIVVIVTTIYCDAIRNTNVGVTFSRQVVFHLAKKPQKPQFSVKTVVLRKKIDVSSLGPHSGMKTIC